jgi:hypothetical protein
LSGLCEYSNLPRATFFILQYGSASGLLGRLAFFKRDCLKLSFSFSPSFSVGLRDTCLEAVKYINAVATVYLNLTNQDAISQVTKTVTEIRTGGR